MKKEIKYYILKTYFSIKGYFKTLKLEKNAHYRGGILNTYSIYIGNNTFYEKVEENVGMGVVFFDQRKRYYPYWQIGMFNFEKI